MMLDYQGNIAEATGANVFFINQDQTEIFTPIPDSFLDGITRRTVIEIAKNFKIKVIEKKIKPEISRNQYMFFNWVSCRSNTCISDRRLFF